MTDVAVTTERFDAGAVSLAVHTWGDADADGDETPILLCHPTGFHGMTWKPVAERLVANGYSVWSFDFRGHGDSDVPDVEYAWDDFGEDVLSVVDHLGLVLRPDLVGVGHSKGAAALVLAEAARTGTFERLWLYEPVIFPSDPPQGRMDGNPLSEGARRRQGVFGSPQEALENFSAKPPLDVLAPEALRAYVDHGLRERDDGHWELKCPGEIEARMYAMAPAHSGYQQLSAVFCPAQVVSGEHSDAVPPAYARALVDRLTNGTLEVAEGLGHFGPMQDPDRITRSILAFLQDRGLQD